MTNELVKQNPNFKGWLVEKRLWMLVGARKKHKLITFKITLLIQML